MFNIKRTATFRKIICQGQEWRANKLQIQYKTSHSQLWAMLAKDAGRLFYPQAVKTLLHTQGWSGSSLSDQTWNHPTESGATFVI